MLKVGSQRNIGKDSVLESKAKILVSKFVIKVEVIKATLL